MSEWVAAGYFAYLWAVALVTLSGARRTQAAACSLAAAVAVCLPQAMPGTTTWSTARDWLPILYLGAGYWLSGLYFVAPMPSIEQRFLAADVALYRRGLATLIARAPRVLLEVLEFAYLTCFVFVPGGMVALFFFGESAHADRFWTLVLASEFGSFGMLPWIQTRPPRDIEPVGSIDRRPILMRRLNAFMVRRTSIGWNTFPSGHVAGSLAVAIAVSEAIPMLTLPLMLAALLISISTITGRYHYAVDAVAGALLTLGLWCVLPVR